MPSAQTTERELDAWHTAGIRGVRVNLYRHGGQAVYRNTVHGAPGTAPYADVDPFARALLKANPQRVVWGSDWPHINYFDAAHVPDDGVLLSLLARWLPEARERQRVLVDNPAALYGFPASAQAAQVRS